MIAYVALFAVLTALALVVTWVCSWPLLRFWRSLTRRRQSWWRWNLVVLALPPFVGGAVAVGAVWPAGTLDLSWSRWTCHCDPAALLHLCVAHPEAAIPLLPMAVSLLVWLLWRPAQTITLVCRRLRAARALLAKNETEPAGDHDLLLTNLGMANAATVGLLEPVVVADRQWWRSLPAADRAVVAAHEAAHRRCRDPLGHVLGQLLAGLASGRLGQPLVDGWLLWAELRADQHAARVCGDPSKVADLLVREKRAELSLGLVPAFSGGSLEARVMTLLDDGQMTVRLGSRLGMATGVAMAAWIATVAILGYPIHIAVERVLEIFS